MQAPSAPPALCGSALFLSFCLLAALFETGCNSPLPGYGKGAAGISATSSSIRVNQKLQLTQVQSGPLNYSVSGVPGGNAVFEFGPEHGREQPGSDDVLALAAHRVGEDEVPQFGVPLPAPRYLRGER